MNAKLDKLLKMVHDKFQNDTKQIEDRMNAEFDLVVEEANRLREQHLKNHGKKNCPKCSGHGAVEKMDAWAMIRFNLREWDGCTNCGGKGEKRGTGYVNK